MNYEQRPIQVQAMRMMSKVTITCSYGTKTTVKKGQWVVFYDNGRVLKFKNKAFHRRFTSASSLSIYSAGKVVIDGTLFVDNIASINMGAAT